jgi:hypothetical protein
MLCSVEGPAQMLGTPTPLFKLIPAIFAARGVADKNCDDWRAGLNAPFAANGPNG